MKSKTKKPVKPKLTPDHAEWLVRHRAETQRVSAKLFRLLKENSKNLDDLADEAQTLVSVAYSLWRAAFLSDKTTALIASTSDAIDFLAEILQNNAIAYSQERNSKNWTFNYYASNARIRLDNLADLWERSGIQPTRPPVGERNPKNRWEFLQRSFEKAVDHFEKLLRETSTSSANRSRKA